MPHKPDHKKEKKAMVERAFDAFFSGRVIGASGDAARKRNAEIKKILGK
jgi:hypothetical protein